MVLCAVWNAGSWPLPLGMSSSMARPRPRPSAGGIG